MICRFCGEPIDLLHDLRCDGRQGRIEARIAALERPLGPVPPPLTPRAQVNAARDDALTRVEAHADEETPGFADRAAIFVIRYLDDHGAAAGEVVSFACKAAGLIPHDDRAFGPVYMRLARAGLIEKIGSVRRERGHGTAGGNIWRLVRAAADLE